jgi:predicted enzyme related to lactoylglutathione lyase
MAPEPSPVIWFEIWVADLERAESFYGALLGWTFRPFEEYDPENYHLASTPEGSVGGALVRIREPARPATGDGPRTIVYAAVPDLHAAAGMARRMGAAVVEEPRAIGSADGWFALIDDQDGNRLGLWSQTLDAMDEESSR